VPQWPQNSSSAASLVPHFAQNFMLDDSCGRGFWSVRLRLESIIRTSAAKTTKRAAAAISVPFWLVLSATADKPEVVEDNSLIEVIWLVEFTGARIIVVVVELAVICSLVVVVVGVYWTTTTLNNWCAEATIPPFSEAIRYALICNTQLPKVVGAVAVLVIETVKTADTGAYGNTTDDST